MTFGSGLIGFYPLSLPLLGLVDVADLLNGCLC